MVPLPRIYIAKSNLMNLAAPLSILNIINASGRRLTPLKAWDMVLRERTFMGWWMRLASLCWIVGRPRY